MATEIRMPKLAQTTDELRFIRWLVAEGEAIEKGQPICEVENDKAVMEVESFTSGTVLRLQAAPDAIVPAGAVIAVVGRPGEKIQSGALSEGVRATPLVRNLARKRGVELARVRGTGPAGLITKADLEAHLAPGGTHAAPGTSAEAGATGAAVVPGVPGAPEASASAVRPEAALSPWQRSVGRRMSQSKREAPHYYLGLTVFMERLLERRAESAAGGGKTLSVNALFVYALSRILQRFPGLNALYANEELRPGARVNVGFAVASGAESEELYVPVVHGAEGKDLRRIDAEVKELTARAGRGELEAADMADGTFTITNLGAYAVEEFYPILNPPQVGIIAIGAIRRRLDASEEGTIRVRSACTITGSFDHRAVNGAQAARFLQALKGFVEEEI
jgi:pyruvate dehydrogenase E2 component (dihydrolipoamide acetyltransferase)